MPTAQMVARFGNRNLTHGIRGEFRYDRTDNRTLCGRTDFGVEHTMTGRQLEITCQQCKNAS